MTKQIIIEFTSDVSGLGVGIEGIEQLLNLDKSISIAFNKTNDTLKQRQQIIDGNTSALQKFVQGLINSQKAAIGDTYSKTLTEIRRQLSLTDDQAKKFYNNIIAQSQQAIISSENEQEIQSFKQLINDATLALAEFGTKKEEVAQQPVIGETNFNVSGTANIEQPVIEKSVEIPVTVSEQDLKNIPVEIQQELNKVPVTPNVKFSDAEVQAALNNLKQLLSAKTIDVELLSSATQQAKEILPTLAQDSEAYKQLSTQILTATQSLESFSTNQKNVNTLIEQIKASVGGIAFEKIDFATVDFTKFDNAQAIFARLRNELSLTDVEFKKLLQDIIANSRQSIIGNTSTQEVANLNAVIQGAETTLNGLGDVEDTVATKTTRATTLLRNMRQELLIMEETGQTFSKTFGLSFDQLSTKAARLQDNISDTNTRIQQLSSESFPLDALVGGLTTVAAGFNAASGAAILFGGDQKDVQEAILKTQAAMQLLNGLQTIYNLLVDQSVVKTGAQVLIKKLLGSTTTANAVAVAAETTALTTEAAITTEAAVAQTALNTAMELNPIGLIIGAVALLVAAFATYKVTIGKVTDEEEHREGVLKAMSEAELKAADSVAKEEGQLNVLLLTAKNVALTDQERQIALDKIVKSYPEYLSSLRLDNLYTSQSAGLIANQINLLKQRALVQATQDLYIEKLKKVAEAEADLNRIRQGGADIGDKLKAFFLGEFSGFNSAEAGVVAQKTKDIAEANKEASYALETVNKSIEGVSGQLNAGISPLQKYMDQFNLLKSAAAGFTFPNLQQQAPVFNPQVFDEEKRKALEVAQYRIDVARKGSAEETVARRAYSKLEFDFSQRDVRLLNDEKQAAYGKYIDTIQQMDGEARDKYFKDTIAASEAIVLQQEAAGKESSEVFFNARRDVLIKTANQAKAQEGITAGEIKKIDAQLNLDLINLDVDRKNKQLEIQKTIAQDRLTISEKGSKDELNAEISILEIEKQTQINNAKNNAIEIQEINDRFRRQEFEKTSEFNQKILQITDTTAIAETQHKISELQLQGQQDTDTAIIELKKKLIEQEAQLEIDSIPLSGITAEKRLELIRAINDKELADKKALEDAKLQAEIDAALKSKQIELDAEKSRLDNLSNTIGAFGPARKVLNDALLKNDLDNIQARKDAFIASHAGELEHAQSYYDQLKEFDDQSTQAQIANANRAAQAKIAAFNAYSDLFGKFIDSSFDNEKQKLEQSAQNNQELFDKKLITQEEFNKRNEDLKKKEAQINKKKALVDIAIDFAKQLFAIKAEIAALLSNPITSPLALQALLQIGFLIASEAFAISQVSKQTFKHGKIKIEGSGTETSDSIPAQISKHESVINAKATTGTTKVPIGQKNIVVSHQELLTAINEFKLNDYLQNLFASVEDFYIRLENIHEKTEMFSTFEDFYTGWQHFTGETETFNTSESNREFTQSKFNRSYKESQFEEYLSKIMPRFEMPEFVKPNYVHLYTDLPTMRDMPSWTQKYISKESHSEVHKEQAFDFDYDKMGEKVGEQVAEKQGKIEDIPQTEYNFSNDEIRRVVRKGLQRTEYLNNKFSSKK